MATVKLAEALLRRKELQGKVDRAEVNREYNHYAKQLRLVDAAIQRANWTTDVEVDDTVMRDFEVPDEK